MLSNPPNTFGYLNTLETHSAEYMCSMFNEVAFQNSPSFCCRLSLSYTRKFIYYGWQVIENHFPLSEGYSINSRLDKARLATRTIAKYQACHVTLKHPPWIWFWPTNQKGGLESSSFILRRQLHNPHFLQKCCHFRWLCFDFRANDNTFERNEDCATVFLR